MNGTRRRSLWLVFASVCAGAGVGAAGAQPPNDTCSGALPLSDGTPVAGSTGAAGPTATPIGALCGQSQDSADVWFSYEPARTEEVVISLCGSAYDTVLSLHEACAAGVPGPAIACNDDFASCVPGTSSRLTRTLNAEQTYLLRVSGFAGDSGAFTIRVSGGGGGLGSGPPSNNACVNATTVISGAWPFSTIGATTDGPESHAACYEFGSATIGPDVWFRFISPVSGRVEVDTCGSTFDTRLAIYTDIGCSGMDLPGRLLSCNDDGVCAAGSGGPGGSASGTTARLTTGAVCLIRVGGYMGATGTGVLNIRAIPVCDCDFNGQGGLTVQDIYDFLYAFTFGEADFNGSGTTTVQDVYDFLSCFVTGCP